MKRISIGSWPHWAATLPREAAVGIIRVYQKLLSPLFPPSCRFYPSCSNYAVDALRMHGLIVGTILSVWRVLRCNPFGKGGYDPVREKIFSGHETHDHDLPPVTPQRSEGN